MSKDESFFLVARSKAAIYLRVHGFGNLQNAPIFNAFAEKMMEEGYSHYVVDLGPCRGVDSTFMGMLLGVSSQAKELHPNDEGGLVLINISNHCRKQLSSIGLDAFLTFRDAPAKLPPVELRRLETKEVSARERLALILKAHQDLISADRRNESKFGPFLRSILRDL